jgi:L-cysteine/cystine lyase
LSDPAHVIRIRQQMPAATAHIYLNAGTFGPLPTYVVEAMQERLQAEWRGGRIVEAGLEPKRAILNDTRESIARLLNADVQEVVLTHSTGEGMNIVSYGFNWHEGDEVITTNHEHLNALGPLYQIRDRYGVIIRFADLGPQAGRPALQAIAELVTTRTRLIAISHITWTTGAVLDINAVGGMGRERGIPVLIDGAQAAGAIPIDVKALAIDFYAIPMQKWLCGPDATGALYLRKEALNYITPTYVGYASTKHEAGVEWELVNDAQRFEPPGREPAAWAGVRAGLNWLEQTVGYQWIFEQISSLSTYTYNALKTLPGVVMLTPRPGKSGLVSFLFAEHNVKEVVKQLREQHDSYIRDIPSTKSLRISTGFYNTEEEIDKMVEALRHM